MSGIWEKKESGWRTVPSRPFDNEGELHDLVEGNIHMLPLAGSPRLFVLGREVPLGRGYADLLAVEESGRPVIVEVKLARSPEAKRAIVAQVLSYAAYLQGYDTLSLSNGPLKNPLAKSGHESILQAVKAQDQENAVDSDTFEASMQEYLEKGIYRLVLILDETSIELERIAAYLDSVTTTHALALDLISFSIYEVNGAEIAMPQRVSPDLSEISASVAVSTTNRATKGNLSEGTDAFVDSLNGINDDEKEVFDRLLIWAELVGELPGVNLSTYAGVNQNRFTLLPRFVSEKAGLVTIWNDNRKPFVQFWRSVFERLAPDSIQSVEQAAGVEIGQGNTVSGASPALLDALTAAYREATER